MQDAFAYCEALVRAADKDRYLATLFVPAAHRDALHALYAFNIEIARVREIVREPLAGEIRLQWWTDAISGEARDARANPIAAALIATIARHRLPADLLTGLIAARRFDLYNDAMASLALLEDYARSTSASLIELAAGTLGESGPMVKQAALEAGLGYALAGLLKAFPIHSARGQLFLPTEVLDRHGAGREEIAARHPTPQLRAALAEMRERARAHLGKARNLIETAPPAALPAFLPVAASGLLLDRMEDETRDPFAPIEIPQWRRQWRLWRAAHRPALIFS
jgi:15-cis-phytoene synthase